MVAIPEGINRSSVYRFKGDDWSSYDLTVTRAGRTYPVAQLTVYDDPARGSMVMAHHDVYRRAVTRKAWGALESAYGYPALEPWATRRAWLAS